MSLNVREWLEAGGFGQYADAFEANDIDGEALLALTDAHLIELGIPLSSRVKLLKAIATLSQGVVSRPAVGFGAWRRAETAGTASEVTAGAERRHLTVMFVDLVGSTAPSNPAPPRHTHSPRP